MADLQIFDSDSTRSSSAGVENSSKIGKSVVISNLQDENCNDLHTYTYRGRYQISLHQKGVLKTVGFSEIQT